MERLMSFGISTRRISDKAFHLGQSSGSNSVWEEQKKMEKNGALGLLKRYTRARSIILKPESVNQLHKIRAPNASQSKTEVGFFPSIVDFWEGLLLDTSTPQDNAGIWKFSCASFASLLGFLDAWGGGSDFSWALRWKGGKEGRPPPTFFARWGLKVMWINPLTMLLSLVGTWRFEWILVTNGPFGVLSSGRLLYANVRQFVTSRGNFEPI